MLEDKIMEYFNQGFVQSYEKMAQDIGAIFEKAIKDTSWAGYLELEKENAELKRKLEEALCQK